MVDYGTAILTPQSNRIVGADDPYQVTPFGEEYKPKPSPGVGDYLPAAFRSASPVGAAMMAMMSGRNFEPEPGFNVFDTIKGTDYAADHAMAFVGVRSRAEMEHVKSRIDGEKRDAQILGASGWMGTVSAIGMGLVDPTIALPGGALYRGVKGGYSAGRSALAIGAAGGVQSAAAEGILQASQLTRRPEEVAHSIAAGTILGGILAAAQRRC
jgi:hypothetical protein